MNRELYVYIDESGTTAINDELYVCVAVLVPLEYKNIFMSSVEKIAKEKCNGIIKSSNIRNSKSRTQILTDLSILDFQYTALIVNKSKLKDYPGLKFSGSFYKFIHRKLATYLEGNAKYDKINFIIDQYGTAEFQKSFEDYFGSKINQLFSEATLEFDNDESNYGIQVSDFIAGTLGRCYFYNRGDEQAYVWREIIEKKCVGHKCFPHTYISGENLVLYSTEEEEKIAKRLIQNAHEFLANNCDSDDKFVERQCEVLNTLLVMREYSDEKYVYSEKLMDILEKQGFESITKQVFTSQVIGKLRNAKIIISGSAKGYKLALYKDDIAEYVKHNDSVIDPMIKRLSLASELLKGSFGMDMLNGYANLQSFVKVFRHNDNMISTEINEEALFEENIENK